MKKKIETTNFLFLKVTDELFLIKIVIKILIVQMMRRLKGR